jgi:methionyl-tRNA formyltransferase
MDIIILTSSKKGSAAYHLEELLKSNKIKIKAVILNQGEIKDKKKYYIRKLKKILKIGIFGAINGIRIRKWYSIGISKYLTVRQIDEICLENNIVFRTTPTINCEQTIAFFKDASPDLGLSLGNGFIGSKIFKIPKYGIINIHHEELPAYQNAQSIIWQLYNYSSFTAFTIHKIDQHIDTGEILYQEKIPITFHDTLAETVSHSYANLWENSAKGLIKVLENFKTFYENGKAQSHGASYTTPKMFQFLRISKNFKKLKDSHSNNKN